MAEPVRQLPAPAAAPPQRRRPALYADVLPSQPIEAPQPARRTMTLLEEIAVLAILAALICFAIVLWGA